ncbi:MAG: nitrous oxide reductase accessory protein NosL [Proteobacteria bacterium]|nr:nitrous oxide reductase accessory protein NosL [Pseudomonadota bacterium]MBU1714764.1 nitrous oxide reductase accessory protein NosL [Pseudomonadota bacterium]
MTLNAYGTPRDTISPDSRCSVCGMFVVKYDVWITQIIHQDDSLNCFDGVKDMMAYYFNPEKYGAIKKDDIKEIWVKDYYSLKWLNGREVFYVTGSDVNGPMGPEFIPFGNKAAAEAFLKDHHGDHIFTFDQITQMEVNAIRTGSKMKD